MRLCCLPDRLPPNLPCKEQGRAGWGPQMSRLNMCLGTRAQSVAAVGLSLGKEKPVTTASGFMTGLKRGPVGSRGLAGP